jgi:hypothetical protein
MSKKELVKSVIDGLIDQGKDFYEITQGTLAEIEELKEISKTTIKRAKNEYKKEKIVVKSNYKETLIKRKIYKYLDRYPKTNLSELREALPEISPSKVSEYHLFWTRKREKAKLNKAQKRVMVNPRKLKEMVFNYLNDHEETTCEQLLNVFPEANKSSVTSYFGHWKKKRASHEKGKEGSLYQVIFSFLDQNESASLDALKDSFTDVPIKSLEVYLNLWQKKQAEARESFSASKQGTGRDLKKGRSRKTEPLSMDLPASDGEAHVELEAGRAIKKRGGKKTDPLINRKSGQNKKESKIIEKLRKTIEKQKFTLTALEVENSILKDNIPSRLIDDFDSMTDQELKDVREFVKTYVRGLKS